MRTLPEYQESDRTPKKPTKAQQIGLIKKEKNRRNAQQKNERRNDETENQKATSSL